MNKLIPLILFVFIAGCSSTDVYTKNPDRIKEIQKIAVLPFTCNKPQIGVSIADSLSANLVVSRFEVIERNQLQKLLAEQGLSMTGVLENTQMIVGKIKNIDAIIVGSATTEVGFVGMFRGGYRRYVSNAVARMIDITNGEVLVAVTFTTEMADPGDGIATASKVGKKLAKKFVHN